MQFNRLERREFIALLGGTAAWALTARAQQPEARIARVGIIDNSPIWDAFRSGLRGLGHVEGRNIAFEYRNTDGTPERLAEAAAELVRYSVDVIATFGTPPSRAAKQATTTIPVVMISIGDPVGSGLVTSYNRPGGNITGNTILGPDLAGKRLQLLKEVVPSFSHVALSLESGQHLPPCPTRGIASCDTNTRHDTCPSRSAQFE
jgi:putative ABC transport system substrate-binding protein